MQWGVGAVLGLWSNYEIAFGMLLAAQAAAAAWLLTAREAGP
jgi:hypothetical protein